METDAPQRQYALKQIDCAVRIFYSDKDNNLVFLGSGFILASKLVLTSWHIFADGSEGKWTSKRRKSTIFCIQFKDGTSVFAKERCSSKDDDLALLELEKPISIVPLSLLINIYNEFKEKLYKYEYGTIGYWAFDQGKETRPIPFALDKPVIERGLSLVHLKGRLVEKGGSGGPVLLLGLKKPYCIGLISESSKLVTVAVGSDTIAHFLRRNAVALPNSVSALKFFGKQSNLPPIPPPPPLSQGRFLTIVYLVACLLITCLPSSRVWRSVEPRPSSTSSTHNEVSDVKLPPLSVPSPTAAAMQKADACHSKLFENSYDLKILILPFSNGSHNSQAIAAGRDYAAKLELELGRYQREIENTAEWKNAELPGHPQIKPLDCPVGSHPNARDIGSAAGADLVIWGQVLTGDGKKFVMIPCITAVHFRELQAESLKSIGLSNILTIGDMRFPQLVTQKPLILLHFMLGLYAEAYDQSRLAVKYLENFEGEVLKGGDKTSDKSRLFSVLAKIYASTGRIQQGITSAKNARESCPEDDRACLAMSVFTLGWVSEKINPQDGRALYAEALRLVESSKDRVAEIVILASAMMSGVLSKNTDRMSALLREPTVIHEDYVQSVGLQAIAHTLGEQGRFEEAIRTYNDAFNKIKPYSTNRLLGAKIKYSIAEILLKQGRVNDCLGYINEIERSTSKTGDEHEVALLRFLRGQVFTFMNLNREAIDDYLAAQEYWSRIKNPTYQLTTITAIGLAYATDKKINKAISELEKGKVLIQNVENPNVLEDFYRELGTEYYLVGRYNEAYLYLGKTIALFPRVAKYKLMAQTLLYYANAAAHLRRIDEAVNMYKEAAALYDESQDTEGVRNSLQAALDLSIDSGVISLISDIASKGKDFGIIDLHYKQLIPPASLTK